MGKVKEKDIRIENWCEYDIRFINVKGNWYAVLKDLCDALTTATQVISLYIKSTENPKKELFIEDGELIERNLI